MSLEQLKREMYARFKENAQLIENPIEHGDNSVDGSFYQVYRGNLESFLDDFAAKAYLQGIRDAKGVIPSARIPEKTDLGLFVNDYEEGLQDGNDECRAVTLEAITRLEENV